MKKTGALLKAERQKTGVSLNEVSMATKISARVLKAIEEGNLDDLPAKTFLRGFVQSYAGHLKMNTSEVLDIFHDEMGSTLVQPTEEDVDEEEEPIAEEVPKADIKELLKPIYGKLQANGVFSKAAYALVFVLLVALIFGVREIVIKYEKESVTEEPTDIVGLEAPSGDEESVEADDQEGKASAETDVDKAKLGPLQQAAEKKAKQEEEEEEEEEEQAEQPKAEAAPKTESSTNNQAEVETNDKQEEPEAKPAEPIKKEEPSPVAQDDQPKQATQTEPAPTAETSSEVSSAKPASDANVGDNEVLIEAFDYVQLEFRIGSGELQKLSLGPNEVHTIKANRQIRIDFSDGGAVNITHNGRDRGVPGDLGKPKKVVLP